LLLDTHVVLFALLRPEALSSDIQAAIVDGPNHLSVASYWEVMLKSMKGSLDVGDPRAWWKDALAELAGQSLSVQSDHVSAVYSLPPIHKDPFDRILIAQAISENLTLVTCDAKIGDYRTSGLSLLS
jgi:PIN domain nuclease of toxin-antitoxin system